MRLSRLFLILAMLFSISFQLKSADLLNWIAQKQKTKLLNNAQWALLAIEADTRKPIIDYHSAYALAPASCLKLVTTGVALKKLGADYRFKTQLYSDGIIDNRGHLRGNIIIQGGGDPTLGSNVVKGSLGLDSLLQTWVQALREKHIKAIEGNIVADISLFEARSLPDNWLWVDIGNYYGASSPALTIHDNLYYLIFKPGTIAGQPAQILRTRPTVPGLNFENHVLTGPPNSGDNAYIYCAPEQFKASVFGTIPAGVDSFTIKGSIPDPALFAAQKFLQALEHHGISVQGRATKTQQAFKAKRRILLAETSSPPLKRIIEQINKRSINLYCELLVKALSISENGDGSTQHGIKVIKETLNDLNVNTEGLHLSDGSGLAPTNAISPKTMVQFLNAMRSEPVFEDYLNSLSLAGDPDDVGYFKDWGLGTNLAKNARIKSGLIEGVRSHSGYLKDRNGNWIIFSFIVNHYEGHFKEIDKIHENLLIKLSNGP